MSVLADVELASAVIGPVGTVVATVLGIRGRGASKRAAKAETRVALLDAVQEYETALEPYRERFLSTGLAIRPGDRELILEHLPAMKAARDRLLVVLHRAEPEDFPLCRSLSELDIRRFNAENVMYLDNAVKAARAEVVSGDSGLSLPDGENYKVISVQRTKLLT